MRSGSTIEGERAFFMNEILLLFLRVAVLSLTGKSERKKAREIVCVRSRVNVGRVNSLTARVVKCSVSVSGTSSVLRIE